VPVPVKTPPHPCQPQIAVLIFGDSPHAGIEKGPVKLDTSLSVGECDNPLQGPGPEVSPAISLQGQKMTWQTHVANLPFWYLASELCQPIHTRFTVCVDNVGLVHGSHRLCINEDFPS